MLCRPTGWVTLLLSAKRLPDSTIVPTTTNTTRRVSCCSTV